MSFVYGKMKGIPVKKISKNHTILKDDITGIKQVIANVSDRPIGKIALRSRLENDLDFGDLDMQMCLLAIEDKFEINIPNSAFADYYIDESGFGNVRNLITFIVPYIKSSRGAKG